ncbi:hypothetical protein QTP88_017160 [Uroleucon formosanum]
MSKTTFQNPMSVYDKLVKCHSGGRMLMSFFIQEVEVSINDFMAKVVTNDKFSGLYISTYGGGEPACIAYADSVAKCGRVCESLDLYARCFRMGPLPVDCLWHVTSAFLDLIRQQFDDSQTIPMPSSPPPQSQHHQQQQLQQQPNSYQHYHHDHQLQQTCPFVCCICDLVLREPVTLLCGHTCCRRCGGGTACKPLVCHKCGMRTPFQPHVDVLVKSLVEKLWPVQLRASELVDEGMDLYRQGKIHSALIKFNQAYYTVQTYIHESSKKANRLVCANKNKSRNRIGHWQRRNNSTDRTYVIISTRDDTIVCVSTQLYVYGRKEKNTDALVDG